MNRALVLFLVATPAAADDTTWRLRLEAGSELDSNVHRTTGGGEGAAGGRVAARVDLSTIPFAHAVLRLDALGAAQAFAGSEGSGEDIGVAAGNLRFALGLGDLIPGIRLSYYDAFQRRADGGAANLHDFRTGNAAFSLALAGERRLAATAGWRFFVYKPDGQFDFSGVHFGLSYARRLAGDDDSSWDLAVAYSVDGRDYDATALANLCPARDHQPRLPHRRGDRTHRPLPRRGDRPDLHRPAHLRSALRLASQ